MNAIRDASWVILWGLASASVLAFLYALADPRRWLGLGDPKALEEAVARHPAMRARQSWATVPRDVVPGGRWMTEAQEQAFDALRLHAAFSTEEMQAIEAEASSDGRDTNLCARGARR